MNKAEEMRALVVDCPTRQYQNLLRIIREEAVRGAFCTSVYQFGTRDEIDALEKALIDGGFKVSVDKEVEWAITNSTYMFIISWEG